MLRRCGGLRRRLVRPPLRCDWRVRLFRSIVLLPCIFSKCALIDTYTHNDSATCNGAPVLGSGRSVASSFERVEMVLVGLDLDDVVESRILCAIAKLLRVAVARLQLSSVSDVRKRNVAVAVDIYDTVANGMTDPAAPLAEELVAISDDEERLSAVGLPPVASAVVVEPPSAAPSTASPTVGETTASQRTSEPIGDTTSLMPVVTPAPAGGGLEAWMIALIVVAAAVCLVLLIVVAVCVSKSKAKSGGDKEAARELDEKPAKTAEVDDKPATPAAEDSGRPVVTYVIAFISCLSVLFWFTASF